MLERFTLGPLRVTFRQWTCYIAVKSIITHAEVWSQGLLVASALRARDCRGAEMHLAKRGDSPRFSFKKGGPWGAERLGISWWVRCVVWWVKLGRMERSGITLVNELEAIHVLSHVPTRGTLVVSRRILGRDWQMNIGILDIYVVFRDDMGKNLAPENPLMFRVSCVGGERRISLHQPEGLFLTFQVFLSLSASLFART